MKHATPHFPLSNHHRDLAIVALAQAGGTVRDIAHGVEASTSTVRRVLKAAAVAPGWGYGMRKFLISGVVNRPGFCRHLQARLSRLPFELYRRDTSV